MRNRRELKKSILNYMDDFLKISQFDLNEEDFEILSDEIDSICDRLAIERVHDTEYTDVMLAEEYNSEDYSNEDYCEVLAVDEFEFKGKNI